MTKPLWKATGLLLIEGTPFPSGNSDTTGSLRCMEFKEVYFTNRVLKRLRHVAMGAEFSVLNKCTQHQKWRRFRSPR